jgi:probable HAF family extracellular repeat protein
VAVSALAIVMITLLTGCKTINDLIKKLLEASGGYHVSVSPDTVKGGNPSNLNVQLGGAAPDYGADVLVFVSPPTAASASIDLFVPPGSYEGNVAVTTYPVSDDTVVELTADYDGNSGTAYLTVLAPVLTGLSTSAARVRGGHSLTGTVTIDGGAPHGASVGLRTDHPDICKINGVASLDYSQSSATFSIDTAAVADPTRVTITASYRGTSRSTELWIDPLMVQEYRVSSPLVFNGSTVTGTVVMNYPIEPADSAVVQLSTDRPDVTQTDNELTIPVGQRSATVAIATLPVDVQERVRLAATYGTGSAGARLVVHNLRYAAQDVGVPAGTVFVGSRQNTYSVPTAISADGNTIVGYAYNLQHTRYGTVVAERNAWVWKDDVVQKLDEGSALAISPDSGLIAGQHTFVSTGPHAQQYLNVGAAIWNPHGPHTPGVAPGAVLTEARGITDTGIVVGVASVARDHNRIASMAFVADSSGVRLFGPDGGAANAVSGGTIVGSAYGRAFQMNGQLTNLGTLPGGSSSAATGISDMQTIVGWSTYGGGDGTHATIWRRGQITDIGSLPGYPHATALGSNLLDWTVGYSSYSRDPSVNNYSDARAFLNVDSVMYDLTSLVEGSGWTLYTATAIGSNKIVGMGRSPNGYVTAYILMRR